MKGTTRRNHTRKPARQRPERGSADLEERQPTAGANDPRHLVEGGRQVAEVSQGVAAGDPVEARRCETGAHDASAWTRSSIRVPACSIPKLRSVATAA